MVRETVPAQGPHQVGGARRHCPAGCAGSYRVGHWRRSWTEADYAAAVDAVRAAIAEGDVYQVNLVQHLCADFDGDPAGLARALAPLRPLEPLMAKLPVGAQYYTLARP